MVLVSGHIILVEVCSCLLLNNCIFLLKNEEQSSLSKKLLIVENNHKVNTLYVLYSTCEKRLNLLHTFSNYLSLSEPSNFKVTLFHGTSSTHF